MLPDDQSTKADACSISAGGEAYISLPDAMQIFRVSRRTLYNWMNAGIVKFAYAPGGSRYLLLSSLALRSPDGASINLDVPQSRYSYLVVR